MPVSIYGTKNQLKERGKAHRHDYIILVIWHYQTYSIYPIYTLHVCLIHTVVTKQKEIEYGNREI